MLLDQQVRVENHFPPSWHLISWGLIASLTVSLCLLIPRPAATILAAGAQGGGNAPSAARRATSGVAELRYRFQKGRTYVYEVTITANVGEMKETREGLSIYEVKSATDNQITLTHSGSLSTQRTRRDGQPVYTFPSIHDPFFWTSNVSARDGELTIDAHGEVTKTGHLTPLPYMLGDFQLLVIEPLPESRKTTWEEEREVTVTEKEVSRFPEMPFGPFGSRQRNGVNRSASEKVSYAILGSSGQTTRIQRTYSLRTDDQIGGKPRLGLTGTGERSFDLEQGVAISELTKYTVQVNEEGQATTIPLTVHYRLLDPEETVERLKEVERKKAALPRSSTTETVSVPTTNSQLAGGTGGIAFNFVDPQARPVIGVRYQLGSWAGEQLLGHLEPLFTRDPEPAPWQVILARDGYALGAVQVDGTRFVNAVRLAFMRLEGEKLDTKDRYLTQWIGTPTGGTPKAFFSDGARVIGIHGKRAAILDAVGLVFEAK